MEEFSDMIFKMREEIYELLMNDNIHIDFSDCYSESGFTQATIIYKGFEITVFSNVDWGIDKMDFLFKRIDKKEYDKWSRDHCL